MVAFRTRLTPAMQQRHRAEGWWRDETFGGILRERARRHPDRPAISARHRRASYAELDRMVDRVAAAYRSLGLKAGDVVTIQLPNRIEFAACFFAAERIGAIATQMSTDFRSREVGFILKFSESRAYVCCERFRDFDYLPMIAGIRGDLPDLARVMVVDAAGGGDVASLQGAIDGSADLPLEETPIGPDEVFRMAFTSGTTGNPKAVIHSPHTTLAACHSQSEALLVTGDDVFLIYLPLGLNWGYLALVQALMIGARVALLDRFSAREALELIEREKVTYIPTAPASVIAMLNDPELGRFDLSSLRIVVSGGASCPVETIRAYRRHMKGTFIELYGMLETGFHTFTRVDDDPEQVAGTVGRAAPGMTVRILDEAGDDVPVGHEGEIAADGPSVHLGYHNNDKANAELFTADGWFRTGDMGTLDADGYLRIVGRTKEIINRGGKKFHPREIEEILYTHPAVLHAAIVGAPDARLGERNTLCVIPRPGRTVTLDEMIGMLKGEVATYKLPEELHIVDEFPFTPTGKLQRHELAKRVQALREGK